jgi:hypothetical protein
MVKEKMSRIWAAAFLILVLLGPGFAAAADQPSYQSLWNEASANSDSVVTQYSDVTLVRTGGGFTFYYFTKPGHFAHPGVIKRTVSQRSDGTWIAEENGWSFASDAGQPAFQAWMAEIKQLDQQMADALARSHADP